MSGIHCLACCHYDLMEIVDSNCTFGWEAKWLQDNYISSCLRLKHLRLPWPGWPRIFTIMDGWNFISCHTFSVWVANSTLALYKRNALACNTVVTLRLFSCWVLHVAARIHTQSLTQTCHSKSPTSPLSSLSHDLSWCRVEWEERVKLSGSTFSRSAHMTAVPSDITAAEGLTRP